MRLNQAVADVTHNVCKVAVIHAASFASAAVIIMVSSESGDYSITRALSCDGRNCSAHEHESRDNHHCGAILSIHRVRV